MKVVKEEIIKSGQQEGLTYREVTYDDGDEFDNVAEYSVQLLDGNFYVMDDNAELDLGIYEDLDGVVDAIVEDLHQRWLDD